jgi:hypothetical protein
VKIALAALLLAACSSHPSRGDCEKIADHMIDIFTTPAGGDDTKVPKEVAQAVDVWRKNLKEKENDPTRAVLLEVCGKEMGSGATSCILAAHDEVALAKCFGG